MLLDGKEVKGIKYEQGTCFISESNLDNYECRVNKEKQIELKYKSTVIGKYDIVYLMLNKGREDNIIHIKDEDSYIIWYDKKGNQIDIDAKTYYNKYEALKDKIDGHFIDCYDYNISDYEK